MPKHKTYSEKLRDPRWQRRRLEILERDDWTCQCCGAEDKTLHVHHDRYRRGCDPWEYKRNELKTVCAECHQWITNTEKDGITLGFCMGDEDSDKLLRWLDRNYRSSVPWHNYYLIKIFMGKVPCEISIRLDTAKGGKNEVV